MRLLRHSFPVAVCLLTTLSLPAALFPGSLAAQTGTVTGTILDASTGQPLQAVQVSLQPTGGAETTTLGGLTNAEGWFLLLNVPRGRYLLRTDLLGFGSVREVVDVVVGEVTRFETRLTPEPISLSEIVVTGVAGATQRTKLPFDVAQVRMADLPVPTMNAAQSLQGKVAGVTVVQGSGQPGTPPSILLRGATILNAGGRSQDPLYIVDGVILGDELVDLDALDIQSIEVVKGAAAASLYGSRAAAGVIQIRTKRGAAMAEDRVRYTFRNEYGRSELSGVPELLTAKTHPYAMTPDRSRFIDLNGQPCDFMTCASVPPYAGQWAAEGESADEWNTVMLNPWPGGGFDQLERFFSGGPFLQSYFSVEGRSGRTNFHVSGSQLDQRGIIRFERGLKRTNFRVNLDQAVREDLTVQTSLLYSRSAHQRRRSEYNTFWDLAGMPAGADLLAPDPEFPEELILNAWPAENLRNPLYEVKYRDRPERRGRFIGSATVRYRPRGWLSVDANMSYDRSDQEWQDYRPTWYREISPSIMQDGWLDQFMSKGEALNGSLTATAQWNVTDRIRNSTQLRYLYESQDYEDLYVWGYEFAVGDVPTFDNLNQDNLFAESYLETIRADGYFLISNFDIHDKYILDALIRNDGSSLFGADERRQWYYRLGTAWRLSQEDFFDVRHVDELKLRYSVGTAGGRPRFAAQYETYRVADGRISPVNLGNKRLKPEFSTEHEAGMDVSLFDYRAVLALTYAQTTTENQILPVPLAGFTGFQTQWRNAGTIESKTWEATLDLRLLEQEEIRWNAKLLFDATDTEITELNLPAFKYGGRFNSNREFYAREGEKIGTFYGVQAARSCAHLPDDMSCEGFAVNEDGFLVWIGEGGSLNDPRWGTDGPVVGGKIVKWGTPFGGYCVDRSTGEESLFCEIGNSLPDFNLGLSTSISWKGLTAYALLSHSHGFDIWNATLAHHFFVKNAGYFDQIGAPEEDQKPIGYYSAWYGVTNGLSPSSIFVEDGTFTKLREVSLDYRLGPEILERVPVLNRFEAIGLMLTGRNLYTWSGYRGFDPEVGETGGIAGSAAITRVDTYQYPNFRNYTFAVELVF